jgi:shikimate dehydrogenase
MFYKLGLLGYPVSHSFSPRLQQFLLKQTQTEGEYLLYETPTLHLEQACETALKKLSGFNITIPHKSQSIRVLECLGVSMSAAALHIGAVNTVYHNKQQQWCADNTDWQGFLQDIQELPFSEEAKALVLGTGGSARAILYALAQRHFKAAYLWGRTPQKLHELQVWAEEALGISVLRLGDPDRALRDPALQLIINTTPVGMHPLVENTPLPQAALSVWGMTGDTEKKYVYDLIYNPVQTQLLHQAQSRGIQGKNGIGMLAYQGIKAFELWTGLTVSDALARAAISQL